QARRAGRAEGRGGGPLLAFRGRGVDHHLHRDLLDPMSTQTQPSHGHTPPEQHGASVATYVRVALILTVVTALEVGVIYIRFLTPIIVPLLLAMAIATF